MSKNNNLQKKKNLLDLQSIRNSLQPSIPLSHSQHRLWLINQLEDGKDIRYNKMLALKLSGNLNIPALSNALSTIIERHESLRTTFHNNNGHAEQYIHEAIAPNITISDAAESEVSNIIDEHSTYLFDLSSGPLIVFNILRVSAQKHVLLVNMHHIVTDIVSTKVFGQELSELYTANINSKDASLPPLLYQYRDFTLWQANHLKNKDLDNQLQYWCKQLDNAPSCITLPSDYSRPAKQTYKGENRRFTFSQDLKRKMNQFSQEHGHTLFLILLTIFNILLSRYSGQNDICIGSPVANRLDNRFKKLIGFFTNTLVFRSQINSSISFSDFLYLTKNMCESAYRHQDIPFENILEELNLERSSSHLPLFQVMFFIQDAADEYVELPGIQSTAININTCTSKYDLSLILTKSGTSISEGTLEYNTDLFKQSTIERLITHYLTLIENCINNPAKRIYEIDMLEKQEKRNILFDCNTTTTNYPDQQCIHHLIEHQANSSPDATAIIYRDQRLTYRELNQKSNQLAHYLLEKGVKPDMRIGLLMYRSLEMIIGLLGTLKAGACYMPIDPAYPQQRINYLIDDSQIHLLLTQPNLPSDQVKDITVPKIELHNNTFFFKHYPRKNPTVPTNALNLAYVNYTSGSTGNPKGVAITHQSVNRLVINNNHVPLYKGCTVLQVSSISFDSTTFEVWGALLNSGTCVLCPDRIPTPEQLEKTIIEYGIDTLLLTPALFNLVVDERPEAIKHIRYLVSGGEQLSKEHINRAIEKLPDTQLFNGYGPTENTTLSTCYPIVKSTTDTINSVPIGQTISNSSAYILDDDLNPLPIGIIGELYVGGAGLARGYLANPKLTAEKFIPHPYSKVMGDRLYKTGDLVKRLDNNLIDFIGRVDNQVKIRGHRIELGEIEQVLIQQSEIRAATVITRARKATSATMSLVAYIVTKEESTQESIRQTLKSQLPDYMIPSTFVFLKELPITASGKFDHKKLPSPNSITSLKNSYVPPNTPAEKLLCHIWEETLQIEKIGIWDNFFSCGGDSILSLQIVSQAREAGLEISASLLSEHQNIETLARHSCSTSQHIPQNNITGTMRPLPIQHWFFSMNYANPHHFNQYYLLIPPQKFNLDFLRKAVEALYFRHDALRLRYQKPSDQWLAYFTPYTSTMVDETVMEYTLPTSHDKQKAYLEKHAAKIQASLNIKSGPLFKAAYFKSSDSNRSRLLLIIHHLVVDGVSWRILLNDLATAYDQWLSLNVISLPTKTHSFKLWAEALYSNSSSRKTNSEIDYWMAQLTTAVPELPKDNNYDRHSDYTNIKYVSFKLNKQYTHALLTTCQNSYRTQINELLLAALAMTFESWTKQSALRINLEGHGREDIGQNLDISQTVGWFTSLFPLTLQWRKNTSVGALIKTIKEQVRNIPSKGLGYGVLYYLAKTPALQLAQKNNNPEIVFNYLGQFDHSSGNNKKFLKAYEPVGNRVCPTTVRGHTLRFTGEVTKEVLHFTLDYDTRQYCHVTMESLIENYHKALINVINHCQDSESGGYTPSDFPLAKLDSSTVDAWQKRYPELEDIYPATDMQLGLLYHSFRDSFKYGNKNNLPSTSNCSYTTQFHATLKGKVNTRFLKQAWEHVVSRHSILRTAFLGLTLDQTQQLIVTHNTLDWYEQDWREKSADEFNIAFEKYKRKDKNTLFDHENPGLMRFSIFKEKTNQTRFIWTHHHSLLDGWSIPIVLDEIQTYYQGLVTHTPVSLPSVEPYRNYIQWHLKQDFDKAKVFWRKELKDSKPTALLNAIQQSDINTAAAQEQELQLSAPLKDQLYQLTKRHQVTLNTVVQCMWGFLLHRYCATNDVIFGETLSGRPDNLPGVEKIVGLLINTIPIRLIIDEEKQIGTWLQDTHHAQSKRERYGYLPLVSIQQCYREALGTSLFNSIVTFQIEPEIPDHVNEYAASSAILTDIVCDEQTHYDLTLVVLPNDTLTLKLKYFVDTHSPSDISKLLEHIKKIFTAMVNPATINIGDLPTLVCTSSRDTFKKIDKPRNNTPDTANANNNLKRTSPTTSIEKQLITIWNEVLDTRHNDIGIHDNFLKLGGHSLLAIRIITRIYDVLPVAITIEDIFKYPTIFTLANHISNLMTLAEVFGKTEIEDSSIEESGIL